MCVCVNILRSYHVVLDDLGVVRCGETGRLAFVGHVRVGEIEDIRRGLIVLTRKNSSVRNQRHSFEFVRVRQVAIFDEPPYMLRLFGTKHHHRSPSCVVHVHKWTIAPLDQGLRSKVPCVHLDSVCI